MARPRSANRRRFVLALIVLTSLTLITLDSRSGRTGPLGAVGPGRAHDRVADRSARSSAVARPIGDWWSGVIDSGNLKRENRKLRGADRRARRASRRTPRSRSRRTPSSSGLLGLADSCSQRAAGRRARRRPRSRATSSRRSRSTAGTEAGIEEGHGGGRARRCRRSRDRLVARRREGARAHRSRIGDRGAHGARIPVTGIAQGRAGSRELTVADFDRPARSCTRATPSSPRTSRTACSRPTSRSGASRASTSRRPVSGSSCTSSPYVDFDALEFVEVLRWVPGEGPVVRPRRQRPPRRPRRRVTTTTTLGDDNDDRRRRPRQHDHGALMRTGPGRGAARGRPSSCRSRSSRTCASTGACPISGSSLAVAVAFDHGPEAGAIVRLRRRPRLRPVPRDAARAVGAGVRAHRVRASACCRAACCGRRGGSRR